mmetsp:Transcript_60801/g.188219  ORF Transcript_60801/g.188219 Transcript_60801/m.188219 type:complete len:251 (-) Transcript_60801:19-771(-)
MPGPALGRNTLRGVPRPAIRPLGRTSVPRGGLRAGHAAKTGGAPGGGRRGGHHRGHASPGGGAAAARRPGGRQRGDFLLGEHHRASPHGLLRPLHGPGRRRLPLGVPALVRPVGVCGPAWQPRGAHGAVADRPGGAGVVHRIGCEEQRRRDGRLPLRAGGRHGPGRRGRAAAPGGGRRQALRGQWQDLRPLQRRRAGGLHPRSPRGQRLHAGLRLRRLLLGQRRIVVGLRSARHQALTCVRACVRADGAP